MKKGLSIYCPRPVLWAIKGRDLVSIHPQFSIKHLFIILYSYMMERLPEGGQGGYDMDDGEGDD